MYLGLFLLTEYNNENPECYGYEFYEAITPESIIGVDKSIGMRGLFLCGELTHQRHMFLLC